MWLRSGDALVAFDERLRIRQWNEEAERVTGLVAEDVLDRPCWSVLGLVSADGALVCNPDCPVAEAVFANRLPAAFGARVQSPEGPRDVVVATAVCGIRGGGGRLAAHLLVPVLPPAHRVIAPAEANLTPRQVEVLGLLAEGLSTTEIQARLFLTEATVRNHIRAILKALGCRSRLEAVVRARERGLV